MHCAATPSDVRKSDVRKSDVRKSDVRKSDVRKSAVLTNTYALCSARKGIPFLLRAGRGLTGRSRKLLRFSKIVFIGGIQNSIYYLNSIHRFHRTVYFTVAFILIVFISGPSVSGGALDETFLIVVFKILIVFNVMTLDFC